MERNKQSTKFGALLTKEQWQKERKKEKDIYKRGMRYKEIPFPS